MTEPAKREYAASDSEPDSAENWRLEATVPYRPSRTPYPINASAAASKQVTDLALAVALRDAGMITERELARDTRDWTAFGKTTLLDHLAAQSEKLNEQRNEIDRAAGDIVRQATRRRHRSNGNNEHSQLDLISLTNPDGRLAAILGLAGGTMIDVGQIEDRQVGARYKLLRKLGEGGLGTVWLARDENLNRYVAVKELHEGTHDSDSALSHFRREAEITGRLEHPGIVPIYQFGRDDESGRAFYAMRFLGRRTLQDAIDEYHERRETGGDDKFSLHRLLSAFVSVCHAVGHAHAQRIIHRDLKPANVALDEFGQVTLLDWGLSKVNEETGMYDVGGRTEPGDLHDASSVHTGRVIGTPLYMAPEQAAGRLEEVDEQTDVYGLGGILYTILTGTGPHHATVDSSEPGVGRAEFLSRIVREEVIQPAKRVSGVSPELNAICMKALAARKFRRYASASSLADDVQRYMAGTPVQAYEAPIGRRLSRWMNLHPTLAQMLLLSASLFVIAVIAVALTARQGQRRLAEARFASAVETAHDLELNLQFEAQALERDLHFISDLPLMGAIMQSHCQSNEPSAGVTDDELAAMASLQTPEQWLDRQSELFDGFLNANPYYLMMATCIREKQSIRELVRSERPAAGLRPIRVPSKQLKAIPQTVEDRAREFFTELRPGSALLITGDQLPKLVPEQHRSPLVLSGVAGVYGPDGELLGINIMELDLSERLQTLLPAMTPDYVNLIVTDAEGEILLDFRRGRFVSVRGTTSVLDRFPKLREVFSADNSIREWADGQQVIYIPIQLGNSAEAKAQLGIVAYIAE